MTSNPPKKMIYTGLSMNPTLREPDILFVFPYKNRDIKRGDIAVFQIPDSKRKATHRIVSVSKNGIRTRGDNNIDTDPYILEPDDIIGVVDYIQRGRKIKHIMGGNVGFLYSVLLRFNFFPNLNLRITNLLFPLYDRLSKLGVLRKILPWRIQPQVYTFQTEEGVEMQLFIGRIPIGRRSTAKKSWQIRRPFRLFIDETSLP